jgi:ApaG protein
MYVEVTNSIEVLVEPMYVDEQSRPNENYFFFAYKVRITNQSNHQTQLLSRRWLITDGHGNTEEVEGPGVVGQQPQIAPGESYEYVSFCPLTTPSGNMRGTYTMVDDEGHRFDINIPLFFLRAAPLMH